MITPLDIENKKFAKQMVNGYSVDEVDDFLDDLTVEYDDCENVEVDIELIKATNYCNIKSKNPILKWLVQILRFILSPLIFLSIMRMELDSIKGIILLILLRISKRF